MIQWFDQGLRYHHNYIQANKYKQPNMIVAMVTTLHLRKILSTAIKKGDL